jgi:hypothetical protein
LRSLFRKERVSQELDEELNGFLEMTAEEKMKQGMSRKDALRAVRLERGNLEVTKEVVRSTGWESFVETCWQDLRYAHADCDLTPVLQPSLFSLSLWHRSEQRHLFCLQRRDAQVPTRRKGPKNCTVFTWKPEPEGQAASPI